MSKYLKKITIIKKIYLDYIRFLLFRVLFILTSNLRRKAFELGNIKKIIIFGQNRIGDNVLSIPALRTIRENFPKAKITIITNRYVKDILQNDGSINEILFYKKENIFGKLKTLLILLKRKWDLGIDLTCDYTFLPVFLLFISKAKFRIGYNIEERGFLFNRPIKWTIQKKHFVDRLFDILKEIDLEIKDKKVRLNVSEDSKKNINKFLDNNGILKDDFILGIHPGGYYSTQRWSLERFAEVADRIIKKYNAKIIIMVGDRERLLLNLMCSLMQEKAIGVYNFSISELMALIKRCKLLICNNSGILHLATALDVPTVSTMGPTDSVMWWPQGENNIVLKADSLSCLGCKSASCTTHKCLDLITVHDMLEAIDFQIRKLDIIK
jgi:heptosyltransferase-2